MAVKLESAARSPALGLLLKALVAAVAVYFLRESGASTGAFLIFSVVFWVIYLRPPFNNRKFLVSAFLLVLLPVLLPPGGEIIEWLFIILWAIAFFLLLGVKNLVFLRRQGSYEALHALIVQGLGALYLLGLIPLVPQVILFLILFLLFREFYFILAPTYPQRLTLVAAALAFVIVEIAWVLSFLPMNFLAGAAFLALITLLFHDLLLHHFQGALNRQIILRNITLFVILSITLSLLH